MTWVAITALWGGGPTKERKATTLYNPFFWGGGVNPQGLAQGVGRLSRTWSELGFDLFGYVRPPVASRALGTPVQGLGEGCGGNVGESRVTPGPYLAFKEGPLDYFFYSRPCNCALCNPRSTGAALTALGPAESMES